jgi:hypothetical protein
VEANQRGRAEEVESCMAMAGGLPPGWTPTALHLDSLLLASVTKGLCCVSQTGTARCRQAAGYGPEVKWLKSRGGQCTVPPVAACTTLMTRGGGARSCTNDTQRDTKPFPCVILAVPSRSWMAQESCCCCCRCVLLQSCYSSSGRAREQTNHMLD